MPKKVTQFRKVVAAKAKERGLSLYQVAEKLDISHSYLSEIMNGNRYLRDDMGQKMALFFETPWIDFYHEIGWLGDDELFIHILKENVKKNQDFGELLVPFVHIWDKEQRLKMIRMFNDNFNKMKFAPRLVKGKNGRLVVPGREDEP